MSNVYRGDAATNVIPPDSSQAKSSPVRNNDRLRNLAPPFESNMAIFGALFAIWVLIDQSFFPAFMGSPTAVFTAPLAALVLWRWNSVKLFLALMLASFASFCWKTPFHVNNVFIGAFFSALILITTAIYVVRNKALPKSLQELESVCFPTMRVGVIAVFFFAVLHKTNTAFLDPAISCAVIHYKQMRAIVPWLLPELVSNGSKTFVIWLTWCTELAIPILLLLGWLRLPSRKVVTIAIIIALGFHFVMSFNGYQNFSMLALAYYVPFLPTSFYRSVSAALLRVRRGMGAKLANILIVLLGTALAIFAAELLVYALIKLGKSDIKLRGESFLRKEGWMLFNFAVAPVVMLGFTWLSFKRWGRENKLAGAKLPYWAYALLAIMTLSSMAPYLGLKTENSFAMFSNLLTEGDIHHWNHVFLPPSMRVFHFQDKMVTVKATNIPKTKISSLADGKFQVVEFEFRREMALLCRKTKGPVSVDYEIAGQSFHVDDAHNDPYLSTGSPYWQEKLMYFRMVPNSPYGICMH